MGRYDNSKGQAVVKFVLWAAGIATLGFTTYKDYMKIKHNEVFSKFEKGIFNYLDRKERENKISKDEYLMIISSVRDNMEEVLKIGYENFIEKQIVHIEASKEIQKVTS